MLEGSDECFTLDGEVEKDWVIIFESNYKNQRKGISPFIRGVPKGGLGGSTPPPPKFRSFAKAEPNSQFRGIYTRNNLIIIWVSFICKLSGTPD
jgi:hypothetical protein